MRVLTLALHDTVPVTEQNPNTDGQDIFRQIPRNMAVLVLR